MEVVDLIYCGTSGNDKLTRIAIENGFKYGLRLPYKKRLNDVSLYFSDQNWKNPNKEKYIKTVSEYRPKLATVLDIEHRIQLTEALEWAQEISFFVETIIMIPKCTGIIKKIPREINGKNIRLGYSVPTNHGATYLKTKFFDKYEVHLLGGSPHDQLEYAEKMNVVSIDCNYHSMEANKFGLYWTGKINDNRWWRKYDYPVESFTERSLKAFELSCKNIYNAWMNKQGFIPINSGKTNVFLDKLLIDNPTML